ncbi:hypothetical protein F5Y16DRAFT_92149 [Xylariaceae sp. FL0255]|nr:hypothetical protein F5Y16DRAFT_92149 [Xylariaceae sp. FL0255]
MPGLEKLERLFAGSKRKERGPNKTTQPQRPAALVLRQQPSSPVFPSPSFLRPTSIHMTPRDAQIDGPERERGRSRSVPHLQEIPHKCSPAASSLTAKNDRPCSSTSNTPTTSLRRQTSRSTPSSVRQARFRFPEDSLFRNSELSRHVVQKSAGSRTQSPRGGSLEDREEKGLLGWNPKHISLFFNPKDFHISPDEDGGDSKDNGVVPTLLPSPNLIRAPLLPESWEETSQETHAEDGHRPPLPSHPGPRLPTSMGQKPQSLDDQPPYVPSPSSETDEDEPRPSICRSVSMTALSSRYSSTYTNPDIVLPLSNFNPLRSRLSFRESWYYGLEERNPRISVSRPRDGVPRSRLLRKSASTSTLSKLASEIAKDHTLTEPTFDDFYALSDDDIAESLPPTPGTDARVPPTPPPKELSNLIRKSRLPPPLIVEEPSIEAAIGEITPPYTPIHDHGHALALPYSLITPQDKLGAKGAADLASKYNFAVVYILSLWPAVEGVCLDPSKLLGDAGEAKEPQVNDALGLEHTLTPTNQPQTTGRLLAAYGLNECASPFEIMTKNHMSALNCNRWKEYHTADVSAEELSRGLMRPIYSDYVAVPAPPVPADTVPIEHPNNRGILFAAFIKPTSREVIPMNKSPEQERLLDQLYLDAQDLVKDLCDDPSALGLRSLPRS